MLRQLEQRRRVLFTGDLRRRRFIGRVFDVRIGSEAAADRVGGDALHGSLRRELGPEGTRHAVPHDAGAPPGGQRR